MLTYALGNEWRIRVQITDTRSGTPLTGLTVHGFFAEKPTDVDALDPAVDIPELDEDGNGWYSGLLDADAARLALEGYVNTRIWERHIVEDRYDGATEVFITSSRRE